ncbi:NtrZ family periplasmic regulatory protein [Brevundimonas sp.]|uniref:NtrZ family periplasmic regulatory protein n=1 Tax=Brevundimonas sp. TaxID=1871086 RepID=UPI002FD8C811
MRFGGIAAALVLAGVFGLADAASAQSRSTASSLSLTDAQRAQSAPVPAAPGQRRSLRWIDGGRWGLDFNLSQPVGREADWGDVEAGAYYRLSPRLRLGASAGLASPRVDPARAPETDGRAQPRVRLESIFKF